MLEGEDGFGRSLREVIEDASLWSYSIKCYLSQNDTFLKWTELFDRGWGWGWGFIRLGLLALGLHRDWTCLFLIGVKECDFKLAHFLSIMLGGPKWCGNYFAIQFGNIITWLCPPPPNSRSFVLHYCLTKATCTCPHCLTPPHPTPTCWHPLVTSSLSAGAPTYKQYPSHKNTGRSSL